VTGRRKGFTMHTGSSDLQTQPQSAPRILVVDDDAEMRALLSEVLSEEGYEVERSANAAEALIRLRTETFSAIVLDKNMPGLSGLDVLPGLRLICPETPVIMITAYGDVATYVDAMEKGVFEYLFKPFRMEELLRLLRRELAPGSLSVASPARPVALS
jgi:DNA-binding NtrC family response regulator